LPTVGRDWQVAALSFQLALATPQLFLEYEAVLKRPAHPLALLSLLGLTSAEANRVVAGVPIADPAKW
jgi:hypothetical protein